MGVLLAPSRGLVLKNDMSFKDESDRISQVAARVTAQHCSIFVRSRSEPEVVDRTICCVRETSELLNHSSSLTLQSHGKYDPCFQAMLVLGRA